MIQDIFPHRLHNEYRNDVVPVANDMVFCFSGRKLLMRDGTYKKPKDAFPCIRDFGKDCHFTYLFRLDEDNCFLACPPSVLPEGFSFRDVNSLRRELLVPQHLSFAAMTAKHLSDWYSDNQFCGRCGNPMMHSDRERAQECKTCGNTVYPRIMPAVIVGVINDDKILITKYRTGFAHNALVAGFTEIGETAEDTVAREVMEEAGIRVKNIRYYKSQPWGVANDLLLGFYCDVDGDTRITMDENELKFAQWVGREEIVLQPDNFSLTNEMMTRFKDGKIC